MIAAVLLYLVSAVTALKAKYDPKYVSKFTPESFQDRFRNDILANSTDGVYLVKFYHPSYVSQLIRKEFLLIFT